MPDSEKLFLCFIGYVWIEKWGDADSILEAVQKLGVTIEQHTTLEESDLKRFLEDHKANGG